MTDEAVRVSTGPSTGVQGLQGLQEVATDNDTRYSLILYLFISILSRYIHTYIYSQTDIIISIYWILKIHKILVKAIQVNTSKSLSKFLCVCCNAQKSM